MGDETYRARRRLASERVQLRAGRGSVIVSAVMSLPTTGPILLSSLRSQDMYLAGSFLMFLAALTVVGMLVSDILLAVLDPRIRLTGGAAR